MFRFGLGKNQKDSGMDPDDPRYLADEKTLTDEQFVASSYSYFLERPADQGGKEHYLALLRDGMPRAQLIKELMSSDEFRGVLSKYNPLQVPILRKMRPDKFVHEKKADGRGEALAFKASDNGDFDWLEEMILKHGYYDKLGAWEVEEDDDKRVIAEMAGLLGPSHSLEIGCFTGAVVHLLNQAGIKAEGVDLSHLALALCDRAVRPFIHFGDILELDLEPKYDLILAMDVFEHLNPNRLEAYLARLVRLMGQGGYVLTNIPAYGTDPVFGLVHDDVFQKWCEKADPEARYDLLHVDQDGWPISGHLIWATSLWWENRFKQAGFSREMEIEKALHRRFDSFLSSGPKARLSFYVFSLNAGRALSRQGRSFAASRRNDRFATGLLRSFHFLRIAEPLDGRCLWESLLAAGYLI